MDYTNKPVRQCGPRQYIKHVNTYKNRMDIIYKRYNIWEIIFKFKRHSNKNKIERVENNCVLILVQNKGWYGVIRIEEKLVRLCGLQQHIKYTRYTNYTNTQFI